MFERIKKWYNQGLWTEEMVLNAVDKGVLTADEANEILNKGVV
jgi:hypothetical protein